jgi:hypothetical protein
MAANSVPPICRTQPKRLSPRGRKCRFAVAALVVLGPRVSQGVELQPETLAAWSHYVEQAKARMNSRLDAANHFLQLDDDPARVRRVHSGEILVTPVNGIGRTDVPNGLVHDWIGAAFLPNTTIEKVFSTMDEYGCYKHYYAPMVIESRAISRDGNESTFSMRWLKKALFVTTVMEGDYKTSYVSRNETSRYGFLWSTRIQDVVNYGEPSETKLPPGTGNGFIWRLFSISRFEERDGGVYVELEAMALSRSVPGYLSWLVKPLIGRLSQSALVTSLTQLREAVASQRGGPDSCGSKNGDLRAHSTR